jgi:hypothetical protein
MVNCNGAMTELAKNMILSGANIIIFDDELVK